MPWKLKLDDDVVALNNGLPVYTDDDGNENTFDPNQMHGKIIELGGEAKRRREENKTLKDRVASIEGIEDVAAYREQAEEAIKMVQNFKDKDLVKAGEVDKLKSEMMTGFEAKEQKIKSAFATQEQGLKAEIAKKDAAIRTLLVSNRFATSPLFGGDDPKTTLPPDIAETYFGKHFEVVDEGDGLQLIARDEDGEPMISRQKIGDPAGFDEAIERIFDRYPGRDKLLRSIGGGSGGSGGSDSVAATTPIAKLKAAYEQAIKDGNVTKQIALKNQLHAAMQEANKR